PPISTLSPYTTLFRSVRPTASVRQTATANRNSRLDPSKEPAFIPETSCFGKKNRGDVNPAGPVRPTRSPRDRQRSDDPAHGYQTDRKSTRLNSSHVKI